MTPTYTSGVATHYLGFISVGKTYKFSLYYGLGEFRNFNSRPCSIQLSMGNDANKFGGPEQVVTELRAGEYVKMERYWTATDTNPMFKATVTCFAVTKVDVLMDSFSVTESNCGPAPAIS